MPIKISPNRMELLKLKKRAEMAKRGHKLLRDKLDELMKNFMAILDRIIEVRRRAEEELKESYTLSVLTRGQMFGGEFQESILYPRLRLGVDIREKTLLNVRIPEITLQEEGEVDCYSLALTPAILDTTVLQMEKTLFLLGELAEVEKTAEVLAEEIEKTRRRVNALEYVLIPQLQDNIKFITMKLDEIERESRTRVMKVKEMLEQERAREFWS